MIRMFLKWWRQQIADLLPAAMRRSHRKHIDALIIEPVEGGQRETQSVDLFLRQKQQIRSLGRFTLDNHGMAGVRRAAAAARRPIAIWLRVPPKAVLEKELSLPIAAEHNLEHVLGYEMDLETPFSADEVWWDWQIKSRDTAQGRIMVHLWLIPKAPFLGLITALWQAGLAPNAIDILTMPGQRRQIILRANANQPKPVAPRSVKIAVRTCFILAAVAIALPFILLTIHQAEVEMRIAKLQPAADRARELQQQLSSSEAAAAPLADLRQRAGSALQAVAIITKTLPDDAYLTGLSLHERKLKLTGQAINAAALIEVLTADPYIIEPAFIAPVTRPNNAVTETFSIAAEVRP